MKTLRLLLHLEEATPQRQMQVDCRHLAPAGEPAMGVQYEFEEVRHVELPADAQAGGIGGQVGPVTLDRG
jgi:hypothetical protein